MSIVITGLEHSVVATGSGAEGAPSEIKATSNAAATEGATATGTAISNSAGTETATATSNTPATETTASTAKLRTDGRCKLYLRLNHFVVMVMVMAMIVFCSCR